MDINKNKNHAGSFLDFNDEDDNEQTSEINLTVEKRKYSLSSHQSGTGTSNHLSFVVVSKSGHRIAVFEHTRNEIYFWNRGDTAACWGFGSRSSSPIGSNFYNTSLRCHSNIVNLSFTDDEERLIACCRSGDITIWDIGKVCFVKFKFLFVLYFY